MEKKLIKLSGDVLNASRNYSKESSEKGQAGSK